MTRVAISSITKRYARSGPAVLRECSLTLDPGELVCLLGASGSGKSTLLRIVAGVDQPDAGDVMFDGISVLRTPAHKRGAALMFQKPLLFPFLNAADNVGFGLKMRGATAAERSAEAARLLAQVGLAGFGGRQPHELSGGEQQRIALARAVIIRPKVLLLDEPFSSLDAAVRTDLQAMVGRLQRSASITTLMVTHDVGEAMGLADRIAVIHNGVMEAFDTPRALWARPPTRRTAEMLGVGTFLRGLRSGGGQISVAGSLLRLPAALRGPDQEVTLGVRSEHLTIEPNESGDAAKDVNVLDAQVTSAVFRGGYVECGARLTDGQTLTARAAATPGVGDRVAVRVDLEHAFEVRQ